MLRRLRPLLPPCVANGWTQVRGRGPHDERAGADVSRPPPPGAQARARGRPSTRLPRLAERRRGTESTASAGAVHVVTRWRPRVRTALAAGVRLDRAGCYSTRRDHAGRWRSRGLLVDPAGTSTTARARPPHVRAARSATTHTTWRGLLRALEWACRLAAGTERAGRASKNASSKVPGRGRAQPMQALRAGTQWAEA